MAAAFAGRPDGRIAQVVEQLTLNQRVVGSSPTAPTNKINSLVAAASPSNCLRATLRATADVIQKPTEAPWLAEWHRAGEGDRKRCVSLSASGLGKRSAFIYCAWIYERERLFAEPGASQRRRHGATGCENCQLIAYGYAFMKLLVKHRRLREGRTGNSCQRVVGSSPTAPTIDINVLASKNRLSLDQQ